MARTAIIIPYRDRASNLAITHAVLTNLHKIDPRTIFVAEQLGNAPFQRGALFNAAIKLIASDYDQVLLHDVDHVPISWDISPVDGLTHLFDWCSLYLETRGTPLPYPDFCGGSVLIPTMEYDRINGYDNSYAGWGAEDDDLRERSMQYGGGWTRRPGKMVHLPHPEAPRDLASVNAARYQSLRDRKTDNSCGYKSKTLDLARVAVYGNSTVLCFYP